jgi:hypothetical protein
MKDAPIEVDPKPSELEDPNVAMFKRKQSRLATIHERLGHLSYARLKLMARAGLIPKDLANVDSPTCPGCAYGKAHRRPWRHKGIHDHNKLRTATAPGQVVSVDQLVSPSPGFVPTHRGQPTTKRYIGGTVFADHFSDFTYVHLMVKMDAEATVEAKLAFERTSSSYGVTIRHYHSDNGLFDTSKAFKNSVVKAGQTLSFCGVNAHHQNGKAENRIKDVTTGGRTALLHAAHRWPKVIDAPLWPAVINIILTCAILYQPNTRRRKDRTPQTTRYIRKFPFIPIFRHRSSSEPGSLSSIRFPVYVLKADLQSLKSHNKWEDRSHVGIFMCHSPSHGSSVPLILNTQSGNVSPQFLCIYDDEFATCKCDAKFKSLWQFKAKFQSKPTPMDLVDELLYLHCLLADTMSTT